MLKNLEKMAASLFRQKLNTLFIIFTVPTTGSNIFNRLFKQNIFT